MNQPTIALKRIDKLLAEWRDGEETPAAAYGAAKAIIFSLKELIDELGDPYIWQKYNEINHSIDAMFNADSNEGNTPEKHRTLAMGSLSVLTGLISDRLG
ncbi:hypothetical protein [Rheinheimera aquimaris]|uniref:hypothetical protein n=1 Tax=Rheinheimera aquimaris TaxID=412437 RepID=UPI003A98025C